MMECSDASVAMRRGRISAYGNGRVWVEMRKRRAALLLVLGRVEERRGEERQDDERRKGQREFETEGWENGNERLADEKLRKKAD